MKQKHRDWVATGSRNGSHDKYILNWTRVFTIWRIQTPFPISVSQELKQERPSVWIQVQVKGCDVGCGWAIRHTHVQIAHSQLWHVVILIPYMDPQGPCACQGRLTCISEGRQESHWIWCLNRKNICSQISTCSWLCVPSLYGNWNGNKGHLSSPPYRCQQRRVWPCRRLCPWREILCPVIWLWWCGQYGGLQSPSRLDRIPSHTWSTHWGVRRSMPCSWHTMIQSHDDSLMSFCSNMNSINLIDVAPS